MVALVLQAMIIGIQCIGVFVEHLYEADMKSAHFVWRARLPDTEVLSSGTLLCYWLCELDHLQLLNQADAPTRDGALSRWLTQQQLRNRTDKQQMTIRVLGFD
jgi:hypothetical protein